VAALESARGFRSCFNFIPEGSYRVPPALRERLVARGFEVGVHDLQHDGKLFRSRADFARKAARINHHLRAWNATGFRSGFMLRNLEWLHELDLSYDSSTFDTDPFEPQSEGAGTIFPFWLPAPGGDGANATGRGYVELPYTLPQDSTLFLVLRERSPDIWLRKLDWIARHGGMALINVHPDYLSLDGRVSPRTYPVSHFTALLDHVQRKYAGAFWQPLPGDLARFAAGLEPRPAFRRAKRVCMVTHSFYESDNRVTRYAEALAARGDTVDVLALRRSATVPAREVMEGVRVFRIQNRFGKTERSRFAYLWPLLRFLVLSSWWITRGHARNRYDVLHIHNMPDFLVFAAWFPRCTGARVILDIHDIVPEFYTTKFNAGKPGATSTLLRWIERRSAEFSDHVIVSNHLWQKKYAARTGTTGRCSVFINNVDTRVFHPEPRTRTDNKLILLFPGGLQWHQGLDLALRAFQLVHAELPEAEFHIYGDGNMKPSLLALAAELGFNGRVKFFEPVRVKEIARIMVNADLGVVPKRADSFGNEAYSTKIMEFMALGVPVVVSKTKIDAYYFDDSVVRFFESGNVASLAAGLLEVLRDPVRRQQLVRNASAYSERHSWRRRQPDYLNLVDELIETGVAQDRGQPLSFRPPGRISTDAIAEPVGDKTATRP
jgi:glycosyltransferase involved in cell wall biosynthesis